MFKRFLIIVSSLFIFSFSTLSAFAWVEPDDSYFVTVQTGQVGLATIYIPYNYGTYFSTANDGSSLVNVNSSQITCTMVDNSGTVYSVRFPSFDIPNYRRSDISTGNYVNLTINRIVESNLPFLSDADFGIFRQPALVNMGSLLLIGVIVVICIMRL